MVGRQRHVLTLERLESRDLLMGMPVISEFMAANNSTIMDGDGNDSDWIEIFNPSNQAVDLGGWHLTDDPTNLDKWTFPALPQSELEPNQYLIVFASGQVTETYVDPAGYLHTDFRLGASGEYLALTDPTQLIVFEYLPEYPRQTSDVSYGVSFTVETLVGPDNSTDVFVPSDASLDGSTPIWALPSFDNSAWTRSSSGVGVGFDMSTGNTPGPANGVRLSGGLVGMDLTDPEEDGTLAVSFRAGGAAGSPVNEEPPKALDSSINTKWLAFFPAGTYYDMQFDGGQQKIVDGYTISSANDVPKRDPYSWTLSGSNDGVNYQIVDTRTAQHFANRFETRLYEFTNPTAYEYYRFDFQTEFGVTGANQPVAIQVAEIELLSTREQIYDSIVAVDVEAEWKTHPTSVFQRIEFDVTDPTNYGALSLNMQYDDGFAAYLNGTRIATSNVPAVLDFDSRATATREAPDALLWHSFDISGYSFALMSGTNVLGIHALDVSGTSYGLLSRPELTAVRLDAAAEDGVFYNVPSPGTINNDGRLGFVEALQPSQERGFYEASFPLTLTTPTPGAEIYFTTNGENPTPENGTLYVGPITINQTTTLKAAGYQLDYFNSASSTHTYLFVRDIVGQDYSATLAAGLPASWGGVSPDYGMDPDVIGTFDADGNSTGGDKFGGIYAASIQDDLKSLPTLSIVMDNDDLFGLNGIYTNSTGEGVAFERSTSVELIHPGGSTGFQVDAGLRIQGGAFRRHDLTKKHSFRLLFKADYGPSKLHFPFFGPDATDSFDTITLRAEANDGFWWAAGEAQYARDEFGRRTQLALGQRAGHGERMHLYINGIYWGLYNPVERPDASFAAMYYGGDKEEWDAINDGSVIDGTGASWNTFVSLAKSVANVSNGTQREAAYQRVQGNNPDGTNNPTFETYLDVDNYIDYLITNFYMGNVDWPQRNWYTARQRGPESTGFKFHMWDAETSLLLASSDLHTNILNASIEAAEPYHYLRNSESFRLRFADRVHRALFNDGPLRTANAIARYQEILAELDSPIVAESARWGDHKSTAPYTKSHWASQANDVTNNFIALRSSIVLNQLRSAGLYPSLPAPVFNLHGGPVASGFALAMSASQGAIYFTTDGSDPRAADGAAAGTPYQSSVPITSDTAVCARVLHNGQWSALNQASFQIAVLAGDYDGNRIVDQADHAVWKSTFSSTSLLAADGSGNGIVDAADYSIWRDNLGNSWSTARSATVAQMDTSRDTPEVTPLGPRRLLVQRVVEPDASAALHRPLPRLADVAFVSHDDLGPQLKWIDRVADSLVQERLANRAEFHRVLPWRPVAIGR